DFCSDARSFFFRERPGEFWDLKVRAWGHGRSRRLVLWGLSSAYPTNGAVKSAPVIRERVTSCNPTRACSGSLRCRDAKPPNFASKPFS
ncbi:hypothetical protein ALC62_04298, partial [Cyphomyrmex costatus]